MASQPSLYNQTSWPGQACRPTHDAVATQPTLRITVLQSPNARNTPGGLLKGLVHVGYIRSVHHINTGRTVGS